MIVDNEIPEPFESYSGEGPYVFVSYAHDDQAQVYVFTCVNLKKLVLIFGTMREYLLQVNGWRKLLMRLKKSSLFVVFVSPRSVNSKFVKSEVGFALSENKYILSIYLEDTDVPPGISTLFTAVSID